MTITKCEEITGEGKSRTIETDNNKYLALYNKIFDCFLLFKFTEDRQRIHRLDSNPWPDLEAITNLIALEENPTKEVCSFCRSCAKFGNTCKGEYNKTWTGCIYKKPIKQ